MVVAQDFRSLQLSKKIVKIIPQAIKLNWMEPYKNELSASGKASGFFIDNQGHILTCAHVVIHAKMVLIEIPSLGQDKFPVDILGVCPKLDLAVLKLKPNRIYQTYGDQPPWQEGGSFESSIVNKTKISFPKTTTSSLVGPLLLPSLYLNLEDSNLVKQGDDVFAIGFPMGQQNLKITKGSINGRQRSLYQIDAPLNPGSSGGPLINQQGQVIGVNSSGIVRSSSIGYAIPIQSFWLVKKELLAGRQSLVPRPFFGFDFQTSNRSLHAWKNSKCPSGIMIKKVYPGTPISQTQAQPGDILCQINGIQIDNWGLLEKKWFDEKMSFGDLMNNLKNDQLIQIQYWDQSAQRIRQEQFQFFPVQLAIREIYPLYEPIDYVAFGGLVVMNLSLNHLEFFARENETNAGRKILKYLEVEHRLKPVLIISYIFPNSYVSQLGVLEIGNEIVKINEQPVHTVAEYREAMMNPVPVNGQNYFVIQTTDGEEVVLDFQQALKAEQMLAETFKYIKSPLVT